MEHEKLLGSENGEDTQESSRLRRNTGGPNSSNSLKLKKLFAEECNNLYFDDARVAKAVNAAVKYAGNLNNLIPSGTFMFFQYVLPMVSNGGRCGADPGHVSSVLTAALLTVCTFWCFFLSFTDTVKWTDGTVHHGIATPRGLWIPGLRSVAPASLAQYRLKPIDLLHASVSAVVFVTSALFTPTVYSCVFGGAAICVAKCIPDSLVQSIPLLVGFSATFVCFMWPSNRRSINQPLVEKIADDFE